MPKVGELTDVGKFVRDKLSVTPPLTNREIADMVINHFPDREFNVLALRQRIGNRRFLDKKKRTVHIVTKDK